MKFTIENVTITAEGDPNSPVFAVEISSGSKPSTVYIGADQLPMLVTALGAIAQLVEIAKQL
jgi:hypothetical protein